MSFIIHISFSKLRGRPALCSDMAYSCVTIRYNSSKLPENISYIRDIGSDIYAVKRSENNVNVTLMSAAFNCSTLIQFFCGTAVSICSLLKTSDIYSILINILCEDMLIRTIITLFPGKWTSFWQLWWTSVQILNKVAYFFTMFCQPRTSEFMCDI